MPAFAGREPAYSGAVTGMSSSWGSRGPSGARKGERQIDKR